MPDIDIPEQYEIPEPEFAEGIIVETRDFLLTKLLRHENGVLHADMLATDGRWFVRGWTSEMMSEEELVLNMEYSSARLKGGASGGACVLCRQLHRTDVRVWRIR